MFFFFKNMESSKEVREQLNYIKYILGLEVLFKKDRVEIFPEYDHVTDKKAHCLFLPFFGGKDSDVKDFIKHAKKAVTTVETLKKINQNTKFNFLPGKHSKNFRAFFTLCTKMDHASK